MVSKCSLLIRLKLLILTHLINRWNNILRFKLIEVHQDNTGHTVLELRCIYSVLMFYLVGNALATCAFLWEILTYKHQ